MLCWAKSSSSGVSSGSGSNFANIKAVSSLLLWRNQLTLEQVELKMKSVDSSIGNLTGGAEEGWLLLLQF